MSTLFKQEVYEENSTITYFAKTVKIGDIKIFTYLSARLYARFSLKNKQAQLRQSTIFPEYSLKTAQ